MSSPIEAVLHDLERGEVRPEPLAALGDPDPAKSAASVLRAARHPDLAPACRTWLEPLLLSARPGFAAQCLDDLASRYRQTCRQPLDLSGRPGLVRVLGASPFLARLLLRHPHWADELQGDPPPPPAVDPLEPDWTAIRIAKYRGLLRITARDLLGRSFADGLRELSDLADACLTAALTCAARGTDQPAPALFALGKLGGRELNFSSDVDLLVIYEVDSERNELDQNSAVGRLVQTLKTHLEAPSEDGFGYRVDLDLRPEGRTGALANSVAAALDYYERFGAEWERQALLRLRHVAGSDSAARAFEAEIHPFVYRRLIDRDAIRRVRSMKYRIEEERRGQRGGLEANLKEGPGGIRDVEFLVQALQLFYGGREERLRTGNVLDALAALEALELLPQAVTSSLADGYTWLRRAEHALQMVEERQTARFPADAVGQLALARRMGYAEPEGARARDRLLDEWTRVRASVQGHFDALVLEAGGDGS